MIPADRYLLEMRKKKPLVHHIMNLVTMGFVANGVLAAGGRPLMARHPDEAAEAVAKADALVLNLGTPDPLTLEAMLEAGVEANRRGIPVVLDPVGVGLSRFRISMWEKIHSRVRLAAICGNVAEISFLIDGKWQGKGVDGDTVESGWKLASEAASQLQTLVVMTGEKDVISDGKKTIMVENGDEWLKLITGTGCLATSLTAMFLSVDTGDDTEKAASALCFLGIAVEAARQRAEGPGSFQVHLLDQLFLTEGERIRSNMRMVWRGDHDE